MDQNPNEQQEKNTWNQIQEALEKNLDRLTKSQETQADLGKNFVGHILTLSSGAIGLMVSSERLANHVDSFFWTSLVLFGISVCTSLAYYLLSIRLQELNTKGHQKIHTHLITTTSNKEEYRIAINRMNASREIIQDKSESIAEWANCLSKTFSVAFFMGVVFLAIFFYRAF